mgnify:CR=1 FL=1
MPVVTPVAIPDEEPTVATPGALLDQTPPVVAELSGVPAPVQTNVDPEIFSGNGFTVTTMVASWPQGFETLYVSVVVPAEIPVSTPDAEPMVATDVLLLIQVPPAAPVGFVIVVVEPIQTELEPTIEPTAEHNTVIVTTPFPVPVEMVLDRKSVV